MTRTGKNTGTALGNFLVVSITEARSQVSFQRLRSDIAEWNYWIHGWLEYPIGVKNWDASSWNSSSARGLDSSSQCGPDSAPAASDDTLTLRRGPFGDGRK